MKNENKSWYVADFETTSPQYYEENGITKVWLYAICNSKSKIIKYGDSIENFMEFLPNLRMGIIYFHNLKFDGSFILNYLLKNNFEYKEDLKVKDNRGFTTLIGEMGEFYQIKINFARNKQVIICDSLKLLPFKVEKIAVDFGLEIRKEIIDYNDYTINEKTLSYIYKDVQIVAQALKFLKDNNMNKMTTASCAYNRFLETQKLAKDLFPELEDDFLERYRNAYRGGRSQVNPKHQGKIMHNVKRYDINSMYPFVMYSMELPYGYPIKLKERNKFKFELYYVRIKFSLKKGHLPTLLKKGSIYATDTYYTDSEYIIEIAISNIDFNLLETHYDIEYLEFLEIYGFRTTTKIFKEYIGTLYKLKNESTGALKMLYKLLLNSLYGKFGSKNIGHKKRPLIKDNHLAFENTEDENMRKYYLPMAIAITSYAHKLLDDNIMITGYDNFVYCDTDSIHTIGELNKEDIDNKELGKFKLESIEKCSKYVRQKCYVVQDEDLSYTITCAGLPQQLKDKAIEQYGEKIFEVFKVGFSISGKLVPSQVNGGVVLKETTFRIN